MATLIAGLWTRPSTGTLARSPDSNVPHLRNSLALLQARIKSQNLGTQAGMKGIFVAPEYYFASPKMGKWSDSQDKFRGRPIEEREKEALLAQLITLSGQYSDIAFVPGTVAWRKPLDRPPGQRLKKNPVTGLRTGPAKTLARRTKNATRLGSGTEYMGGQRKAAPPLIDAIDDCIQNNNANLGTDFNALVNGGASPGDAFWDVVNDVLYDQPFLNQLINTYGLSGNCYTTIPSLTQKQTNASGAATHMMRNTAYLLYGGRVRFKYNKVGDFHESIGDGSTVFVPGDKLGLTDAIEGITFGMEICLDHNLGVFSHGFPGGKRAPHVHIVVSDSVDTDPSNMKARNYFLHASTSAAETSCWTMQPAPAKATALPGTDSVDGGTISYWRLSV